VVKPKSVLEIHIVHCSIFLRCRVRSCNLIHFETLLDKPICNESFMLSCGPIYTADVVLALYLVGFSAGEYMLLK
jgi:hypothetical protein